MAFSFVRQFASRHRLLLLCAAATLSGGSLSFAQSPDDGQSVSVRRPSLELPSATPAPSLNLQRERLFNELAEEFNTFDRLGNWSAEFRNW